LTLCRASAILRRFKQLKNRIEKPHPQSHESILVPFHFTTHHEDNAARRGTFTTPRGPVETPAFMPVGTLGTVKGLTIDQVRATGAQMILGNTYHLTLRPGEETVAALGGLHNFSGWEGPILTDSGGFQIFSLASLMKITEEKATFSSHIDGSKLELTPEHCIKIQETLGTDVAMQLDHVVALPNKDDVLRDAMERSVRWAARCKAAKQREDMALFAIVQGGLDETLRRESAQRLVEVGFDGYAIGGLSVGEPPEQMYETLDFTVPELPKEKPRYLMGVGRPEDLLEGIARGVDLFDCVMPTRNGRNATAFTRQGKLKLRNAAHARDTRPLDEECACLACKHSRGYIRHLFQSGEMLGPILLTLHNLTYYQDLVRGAREAIETGNYDAFLKKTLSCY